MKKILVFILLCLVVLNIQKKGKGEIYSSEINDLNRIENIKISVL